MREISFAWTGVARTRKPFSESVKVDWTLAPVALMRERAARCCWPIC
jgi:hypothetical protein